MGDCEHNPGCEHRSQVTVAQHRSYAEHHRRLSLEIDHADLPAVRLVELADRCLARALAKGLPFPVDVDGEEALRRARSLIQIALDN